jgi:predicted protein tyrosine phosphatase
MTIALTSEWGVPNAVREFRPHKLITLLEPPCDLPTPVGIEPADHLRIAIHDIIEANPLAVCPEPPHIERLLKFGEAWIPPERLLLHCAAGISRSSAALILLLVQKNPGRERRVVEHVRERATHVRPNTRIIELGDDALGCDGRLIQAVARMREPTLKDFGDKWVEFAIIV